jgi:hypothetical protein
LLALGIVGLFRPYGNNAEMTQFATVEVRDTRVDRDRANDTQPLAVEAALH